MATDRLPDFRDIHTAFRHESTPGLLKRLLTFQAMCTPVLRTLGPRLAVANVGNPLGRFLIGRAFDIFLGGEDLRGCRRVLDRLERYGSHAILDYMAERASTPDGRDRTCKEIRRTIEFSGRSGVPMVACKPSGIMDVELLRKVQEGRELDEEEAAEFEAGKERLVSLCELCAAREVRLTVDAEWVFMQGVVDDLVLDLMRRHNSDHPVVGHTLQMYRRVRLEYLEELLELSRTEGWWFSAKLVRGAYMDFERAENPVDPIHPTIEDTHRAYDAAVELCLDHLDHAAVTVATHNQRSVERTYELLVEKGLALDHLGVETAQLIGMSDLLTFNVAAAGARAAKYLPYGPLEESVPYLVRRAEENAAITDDSTRERDTLARELWRRLARRTSP